MSFRTQVRVVNGRLSLLPVTIEQFLNHAVCGSRCLFCQKITRLPRKNYLSQSERSPRHVTVRLSGSAISKTRLIWLKQAIMLPDKRGPNSRRRGVKKEISWVDVCTENDIFVLREASLKNARAGWSPRDEWIELGRSQESSSHK